MTGSCSAKTAPKGRPFQKGDDPRRNKQGARSKEAQSFAERFANSLASGGDPKDLAAILWEKALKGQPWAVEVLLDRLIGKVTQPISGDMKVSGQVLFIMPRPGKANG
jgi:hypothetical protein